MNTVARQPAGWSLRKRLAVLAGVATLAAWLAGGLATLWAAREEGERLYDQRLRDVARVILSFASHEIAEIRAEDPSSVVHKDAAATLDARYRYQVWSGTGELLLTSDAAPQARFAPAATASYLDRDLAGRTHRVYVDWNRDRSMQIQVAEDLSLREVFSVNVRAWVVLAFVVSTLLLVPLNLWLIGRATRALSQSAQQLSLRSVSDLRPIATDDPPQELASLLASVNALFGRVEHSLDSERHFTAAAAHELRTPLAAVKVQAQVAEHARTPAEMRSALSDLRTCVDRAARMIDQLLTLARVEEPTAQESRAIELDLLAAGVVRDLAFLSGACRVAVDVDLQPCTIDGMEFGVAALLRNLVDNALRYSPANGRVSVSTRADAGASVFTVDDAGPGIAPAERARVFERFYRGTTDGAQEGCGVGLSIVRCVAQAHHASVHLEESPLGGLRASVRFPPARTR